jgi:uncharacterized protein YlxW (UPF0749 family)
MRESRPGWAPLVALVALGFGFLLAVQVRSQVIPSSDRVARNAALVAAVRRLEDENGRDRGKVAALRTEIATLEATSAGRSDATRKLATQVDDLRAHAGLTPLEGPGVKLTLGNGRAGAPGAGSQYLVTYEDVQDAVNLLYGAGAEGIAVSGRRLSPESRFQGSGTSLVIDDGPPLRPPFEIDAVGDRARMEAALDAPASLGDLKRRQELYGLALGWTGAGDLRLPAYDSSLELSYAHGG